jgi:hypothetical protein
MNDQHEYPSNYPPGKHWAIDAAWEILDTLKPGVLSIEARSLLAGMITGRLMKQGLEDALEQSVKLQSHYAKLLNAYDGGKRRGFASAQQWMDRLKEIDTPDSAA